MGILAKPNTYVLRDSTSKKTMAIASALVLLAKSKRIDIDPWVEGKDIRMLLDSSVKRLGIPDQVFEDIKKYSKDEKVNLLQSFGDTKKDHIADLLAAARTSFLSDYDQKNFGAVFTPKWLADKVTQTAWQHWNKLHRTGRKIRTVADISCGTGVFLSSARDFFGNDVDLYGSDVDENSLVFSNILNEALELHSHITLKDPLLPVQKESVKADHKSFDILIGNPPYVRSQHLAGNYVESLKNAYPDIALGNFDLSVIFIEHAIQSLSEGGIASYLTTSKFMHSEYGKAICGRLAKDVKILNIIDFKDSQLFPDHTTYTSVITFAKLPAAKKFTVTHFPSGIKNANDLNKSQTFSLHTNVLEKFPWNLATDQAQSILQKINNQELPLIGHTFPNILQGLRTGQNDIFVLPSDTSVKVEKDLARPFVGGEEIKRLSLSRKKYTLIYPYHSSSIGKVMPIEEDVLKREAPHAYAYFQANRRVLTDRNLDTKSVWYAYSRVQNLHLPQTKKILVKEMMPSSQFAADVTGDIAIGSGYALVNTAMSDGDLEFWSAVLSTEVMEFALRHSGTQLQSGWFRLLKHHLQSIRLPKFDDVQDALARDIVKKLYKDPNNDTAWDLLDDVVASAFSLTPAEHAFIHEYIANCHTRSLPRRKESAQQKMKKRNTMQLLQQKYVPVEIKQYLELQEDAPELRRLVTFQINKKLPIHRWFPFTQGYSEPLVDFLIDYMGIKKKEGSTILDPFVGSGTTILTGKKRGIHTISLDISPLMIWVTKTKIASMDLKSFEHINDFLGSLKIRKKNSSSEDVFPEFLSKAYSSNIWSQVKHIHTEIIASELSGKEKDILMLGLVAILEEISQIRKHGSHYRYMLNPDSIGLQKLNTQILNPESDIVPIFKKQIAAMLEDIDATRKKFKKNSSTHQVSLGDAKNLRVKKNSIDFVITSPPYLNRNNYIAQQKAELSLLSFVKDQSEYKKLVRSTFRSHTDSDLDVDIDQALPEVRKIIAAMDLTDGNNSKIPQMIAGYFLDLEKSLEHLFHVMRKGGKAAFVVGNSRWGGVVVPVDHLLLLLAEKKGFKAEKILVSRMKGNSPQQMKQFGKIPVRESVVIFQKP